MKIESLMNQRLQVMPDKCKHRSFLIIVLISILSLPSCQPDSFKESINEDLTKYVDPFIGSDGHGHVFVGANVPFGMVQAGPANFNKGWDWSSSYHYSDSIVRGFSHLNLSGTGCTDLGELVIMPTVGKRKVLSGTQDNHTMGFASLYRKATESVKPGYYKVELERYNIQVEITATERAAIHRYIFPAADEARIIIDLNEGNDEPTEAFLQQVNDTTFLGYRYSKGWAPDQEEYIAVVVSKPVLQFHIFDNENHLKGIEAKGNQIKGFLEFATEKDEQVFLKIGVSPVSMDNAMANLRAEIPDWDFDGVYAEAKGKWNSELTKIEIKTAEESIKRIFYTSMYHTMMAPTLYNDHDETYRGTDKQIYKEPEFTNYTVFSLWDTYRAAHPLYTIIQPERVSDMINSMLAIYQQQGKLPVWHLRGNETECMVGYSAVPVVVDACLKGFDGIDQKLAYTAVMQTATGHFEPGVKELMELGHIPANYMIQSVASAMEYAISDWAISKLAEQLGKVEDATYFYKRSNAFQDYFDPQSRFMRGKLSDGKWRSPFDPIDASHGANDYCEGNAWQYLWLVPQNPEGLIELLGGDEAFVAKLDSLFTISSELGEEASVDITGLIGQYAHGNEPGHHTTYLYSYAGQLYKTADKVRTIMKNYYTDEPNGICGNEDCGQMSAWYIFSSMGFYPVNPVNGLYVFGSPILDRATIRLSGNKQFTITTENCSDENKYIQKIILNGEPYPYSYITHNKIVEGGTLTFVMGSEPNVMFAKHKDYRPKSKVY